MAESRNAFRTLVKEAPDKLQLRIQQLLDSLVFKDELNTSITTVEDGSTTAGDGRYVRLATADTITAKHTFAPASSTAPFSLGTNALNQLVTGLNADYLDSQHGSYYLNASNINAGTLAVAYGGTGLNSLATGRIPYGAGTSAFGNSATFVYSSSSLGVGTAGPDRTIDSLHASDPQLRLTQADGTVYTDLQTTSSGYLALLPSGLRIGVNTAAPLATVDIRSVLQAATGDETAVSIPIVVNKASSGKAYGINLAVTDTASPDVIRYMIGSRGGNQELIVNSGADLYPGIQVTSFESPGWAQLTVAHNTGSTYTSFFANSTSAADALASGDMGFSSSSAGGLKFLTRAYGGYYYAPITAAALNLGEHGGAFAVDVGIRRYSAGVAHIFNANVGSPSNSALLASTLYLRDTAIYAGSNDDGHLDLMADVSIDLNTAADTDLVLNFAGTTNSGVLTWMEDEDYFKFSDGLFVDAAEELFFRDTAIYLYSQADGYLNIVADTGVRIGDATPTNYTQFDSTGHQTMVGTAKPWTDLRVEPVARTTGANAPTFEKWYDDTGGTSRGVYLYSFDDATAGSEKEIFFTMQMPHEWDQSTIHIHVHWIPAVSDTTATPRWGLEYIFKEPGAVFGDTVIIYATGNVQSEADLTANKHYITDFADITPDSTQDGLSSILIGRLFRDSANAADTYNAVGAKCGLLYIDAHFQLNSIGSTDEYTK